MNVARVLLFDANDCEIRLSRLHGNVVVIIGGGRQAAFDTKKWGKSISEWADRIDGLRVLNIAFVRPLPPFIPKSVVRWFVRYTVNKGAERPVLFDWDLLAAHQLCVQDPDRPNILVIDQNGKLRVRGYGEHSERNLKGVQSMIMELLLPKSAKSFVVGNPAANNDHVKRATQ
jgi:hypothetical protein